MHHLFRFKSVAPIILAISYIFVCIPVSYAAPPNHIEEPITPIYPTPNEHIRAVQNFITALREIQFQVFDIAQFAQVNPPEFEQRLADNINFLNRRIDELTINISDYLKIVPPIGDQNTHILLLLNTLNFIKNSLYSLNVLTTTTTNVLRIRLLDEYFRSRIAGIDTLTTLENLILYYPNP